MRTTKKPLKSTQPSPGTKAKSDSPKRTLKVFINVLPNTKVIVKQWELSPGKDPDPERVDIQTKDLCYCTILDPLEPKIETWGVTEKGNLSKAPIASIGLPFVDYENS